MTHRGNPRDFEHYKELRAGFAMDAELARFLGITPSQLSNWKRRHGIVRRLTGSGDKVYDQAPRLPSLRKNDPGIRAKERKRLESVIGEDAITEIYDDRLYSDPYPDERRTR